jgi:membrane protein implicated in regulation of membrane protease activity
MGRFRASSLGSGAVILALLLLVLHRNGTGLLFLVVGGALLWYGRRQREAQEREGDDHGDASASGVGAGAEEGRADEGRGDEPGNAPRGDGGS